MRRQASTDDIDNRIFCSNLVKMHGIDRRAVGFRFDLGNCSVDRQAMIANDFRQVSLPHNALNVTKASVSMRTMCRQLHSRVHSIRTHGELRGISAANINAKVRASQTRAQNRLSANRDARQLQGTNRVNQGLHRRPRIEHCTNPHIAGNTGPSVKNRYSHRLYCRELGN
jgi:hypothetical protein